MSYNIAQSAFILANSNIGSIIMVLVIKNVQK